MLIFFCHYGDETWDNRQLAPLKIDNQLIAYRSTLFVFLRISGCLLRS